MKTSQVKKLLLFVVTGLVFGFIPLSKVIAADLTAPQITIEEVSTRLKEKLQDEAFTTDFAQINVFVEDVINPHVDFNRISALVLGKLWKKASKNEKLRFKQEFKILLVRTYSRAFVEFKDWSVRFLPLRTKAETKKVIVKTEILQPGIQPLAVNYRMVLSRGTWKVYDIMIEGVSLVTNYRTSIKNEVKKHGSLNAVIEHLAKKNTAALAAKENS
ncbi:MAG: ABC transporter substrate-binding protein [Methylococcales bacterium]|nr:ABC transporter substrate-binding protein [Methylococcales bacterium]MCK5477803.1 ABC transporter substrate-binding protein [Methylococcales bacterium]